MLYILFYAAMMYVIVAHREAIEGPILSSLIKNSYFIASPADLSNNIEGRDRVSYIINM